ncbi:tachykinin-like peptides receptor 99D [Diadema antillarum]|uniref:tachykinin-like peptides receptor 99D n=2 Tax=Diadema antillarum TaxID=105358 RepID=UPI003A873977
METGLESQNASVYTAPESTFPYIYVYNFNYSAKSLVSVESVICWSILATIVMVVAAFGNIIVIWIVLTNPRMRTVTNYFLLNLAIADTMIATIDMPLMFTYIVTDNWPFGRVGCKMAKFLANLSAVASILSLMAVTVDRFRAIVHPLLPRLPKRVIIGSVISIWIVAGAWTSPLFLFGGLYKFVYVDGVERIQCHIVWPPDVLNRMNFTYTAANFVVTYCVPLAIMAVCYTIISTKLWGNGLLGENIPNRARQITAKRKIVKMIVIVVAVFAICWLPLHSYHFLPYLNVQSVAKVKGARHIYIALWLVAMSSSMYNPFIYCWLNDRFRYGFKRVFLCLLPIRINGYAQQHGSNVPASSNATNTTNYMCSQRVVNGKDHRSVSYRMPSVGITSASDSAEDTM